MKESVSLVNEHDQMFGTMDKMAAHRSGALHRALSVFVFNSRGELLLQQRAVEKYHSGGLWTNTCCSHPRLGESMDNAAYRRLQEEMGIHCLLDFVFKFTYRANVGNGLVEHEIDHVFFGVSDDVPLLDPTEAAAYKYMSLETLGQNLNLQPENYTEWLKISFDQVTEHFAKLFNHVIL